MAETVDVRVRHVACKCEATQWSIIAVVENAVTCMVCDATAIGVYFHCKGCGNCYCADCISEAANATFADYAQEILAARRKERMAKNAEQRRN